MKSAFFFFTLLIAFPIFSQDQDSINRKRIEIHRIEKAPQIDGVLDEVAWQNASVATDFIERIPKNGVPIPDSLHTEVKIIYDDLGIYFGAIMTDPQIEKIPKELTERDNIRNDDFFFILLNGYNDRQQSLQFIVTAAGVQYDAKMTNGFEDDSWNAVWYSAVQLNKNNWVVEMFIPYSELRFPEKDVQVWGLNMEREYRRTGTRYSWSPVDNRKGSFSFYDGEIYGIEKIQTPTRLSFQPYLSTYVNNYDGETETTFNGGMDLKYGINDAFTLDMILIPDFGQAKFDETVLNLSAFEVQYEEQRSFFTEGTEMFSKGDLFYSRRIGGAPSIGLNVLEDEEIEFYPSSVDLINAVKISGRTDGGLGIGFFNAVTERTFAEIKNTLTGEKREVLVEPISNYNVFVLDQRFGGSSSISLVNTNLTREGSFRDANATGIYTSLTNKKNTMNYWLNAEGSWVMEEETKFGAEGQIGFSQISGENRFSAELDVRTKDYDINDMGYSSFTNYLRSYVHYSYQYLQPKGFLNNMFLNFNLSHERRLDPDLYGNFEFNFNSSFTTKKFFNFGGGFEYTPIGTQDFYEPRVFGRHVDIPTYYDQWLWFGTDFRKRFTLETVVDWYKYDERRRSRLIVEVTPTFRVSDQFTIMWNSNLIFSDKEEGFVDIENDEIIFGQRDRNTFVNSLESTFIFNNKMSLNLAFRHYFSDVSYDNFYNLQNDGGLSLNQDYSENHNTTYNSWNIDLRYSWWFAPGSQLTLLYRNSIQSNLNEAYLDLDRNFNILFDQPQVNSLSLRISYYLDYNRMKSWFQPKSTNTYKNRKMGNINL
ncbi:MAG TPA: DUF5916 domain-containing protein [Salinimicrobium sp.]|nr:DUF5916 domain-containing protein [Salinimicrobium sp.]